MRRRYQVAIAVTLLLLLALASPAWAAKWGSPTASRRGDEGRPGGHGGAGRLARRGRPRHRLRTGPRRRRIAAVLSSSSGRRAARPGEGRRRTPHGRAGRVPGGASLRAPRSRPTRTVVRRRLREHHGRHQPDHRTGRAARALATAVPRAGASPSPSSTAASDATADLHGSRLVGWIDFVKGKKHPVRRRRARHLRRRPDRRRRQRLPAGRSGRLRDAAVPRRRSRRRHRRAQGPRQVRQRQERPT